VAGRHFHHGGGGIGQHHPSPAFEQPLRILAGAAPHFEQARACREGPRQRGADGAALGGHARPGAEAPVEAGRD
jgi:hypothetical protein